MDIKREIMGKVIAGEVKLDQPVDLPENCRVCVVIESLSERRKEMRSALESWQEVCRRHPIHSGGRRFTRDELHERD